MVSAIYQTTMPLIGDRVSRKFDLSANFGQASNLNRIWIYLRSSSSLYMLLFEHMKQGIQTKLSPLC